MPHSRDEVTALTPADASASKAASDATPLSTLIDSVLQQLPQAIQDRCNAAAIGAELSSLGIVDVESLTAMMEHDYQEVKEALKGMAPPIFLTTLKINALLQQRAARTMNTGQVLREKGEKAKRVWNILSSSSTLPNPEQPNLLEKISTNIYQNSQLASFLLVTLSSLSGEDPTVPEPGTTLSVMNEDAASWVTRAMTTGAFACILAVLMSNLILRDIFSKCNHDEDAKRILIDAPRWALTLPYNALKLGIVLMALLWTWLQLLNKLRWEAFLCHQVLQWGVLVGLPLIITRALDPESIVANRQKPRVRHKLGLLSSRVTPRAEMSARVMPTTEMIRARSTQLSISNRTPSSSA